MQTEKEVKQFRSDVQLDIKNRKIIINQDALKTIESTLNWVIGD